MKSDIIVIGGGASGLMAAYQAAYTATAAGQIIQVTVLEKMPRPARKVMITGKGRCNFTNLKDWNEFSAHIRTKTSLVKPAFYNLPSSKVMDFFEGYGTPVHVERGDRAFPDSYHASDIVDTLVSACFGAGVKLECESEVTGIVRKSDASFELSLSDGRKWLCRRLIIATGGLSYPTTGSTGDGYRWAEEMGHHIEQTFPSLTALVPKGYKMLPDGFRGTHVPRELPLSETGEKLCGVQLKNIQLDLLVEGTVSQSEFGDVDFTDGGIEGPVGFQLSRKAVKSMVNGSRVSLVLDMKPGVELSDLTTRVRTLWTEVDHDPRSKGLREKEKCRILLGKLMPRELIPGFTAMNPDIITLERKSRTETKVWVNILTIAKALKAWRFDVQGHVGYERAVITAGGVSADDVVPKTLESRLVPGLFFCGEVLDMDCDTGGYNLQLAFSTGALAGTSASKSLK